MLQVDTVDVMATPGHGASGHDSALVRPVTWSARANFAPGVKRVSIADGQRLSLRMANRYLWVTEEHLRGESWVVVGIYQVRSTRHLAPWALRHLGIPVWTQSARTAMFDIMAADAQARWRRRA